MPQPSRFRDPEQRRLPHDARADGTSARELAVHRLGDDEPEVVRQAVAEPLPPVRGAIGMAERRP